MKSLFTPFSRIPRAAATTFSISSPPRTRVANKPLGILTIPQPTTRRMASCGTTTRGETGVTYNLLTPLGKQSHGSTTTTSNNNVWKAVDTSSSPDDKKREYVAKGPPADDDASRDWPAFRHEVSMQRLFAEDKMIRPMVDFVPASQPGGPLMILKPFQMTLWEARCTRPMTVEEIKWIMEGCLLGVMTVHQRGLVYTDLKMENVGISGFDLEKPNTNVREIIVRLADCGSISEPGSREISALAYRSPEVLFGKPWDEMTDVWSWGIILAQLLLARVDFDSPSMYDAIPAGNLQDKTKVVRDRIAVDFNLHSVKFYAEDEGTRKLLPPPQPEEAYLWAEKLMEKGLSGEDIQFLVDVLHPVPRVRMPGDIILKSGYLKKF